MWLIGIFGNVSQVETKGFAEATEFNFALIFQAEFECLLGDLLRREIRSMKLAQHELNTLDILPPTSHYFSTSPVMFGSSPTRT